MIKTGSNVQLGENVQLSNRFNISQNNENQDLFLPPSNFIQYRKRNVAEVFKMLSLTGALPWALDFFQRVWYRVQGLLELCKGLHQKGRTRKGCTKQILDLSIKTHKLLLLETASLKVQENLFAPFRNASTDICVSRFQMKMPANYNNQIVCCTKELCVIAMVICNLKQLTNSIFQLMPFDLFPYTNLPHSHSK